MPGVGIASYATHIPYWRLQRATIDAALGGRPGTGSRAVAAFDEDTTTMAVEAGRAALAGWSAPGSVDGVLFATAQPAYADKTNATAIHAALGLGRNAHAADLIGTIRSGVSALLAGSYRPGVTLVALSDARTGPAGSVDESTGGDAAAAFVLSSTEHGPIIAELLGAASTTEEFLDRWRAPGEPWAASWEERFGEEVYTGLAIDSFDDALKSTGLSTGDVDRIAVAGLAPRAVRAFLKRSGVPADKVADDLTSAIGNTGTAHVGLLLASMLDQAEPGDVLALTVLSDGAETLLFRATDHLLDARQGLSVDARIANGNDGLSYAEFLTWKGQLRRQQPRRPDPDRAAAPATHRLADWKFGFTGSRCTACGTRHLPPQRVCLRCGATNQMERERLADTAATIATYTVDHLAFSLAPPVVAAVIDFDGGGRFSCELTDVDADVLAVGQRVEMTFRRLSSADGVHNYFWKARPRSEGRFTSEGQDQ